MCPPCVTGLDDGRCESESQFFGATCKHHVCSPSSRPSLLVVPSLLLFVLFFFFSDHRAMSD